MSNTPTVATLIATPHYPEIESKGFTDFKRRKPNPYATGTDHHEAWNIGASKRYQFECEIDKVVRDLP